MVWGPCLQPTGPPRPLLLKVSHQAESVSFPLCKLMLHHWDDPASSGRAETEQRTDRQGSGQKQQ